MRSAVVVAFVLGLWSAGAQAQPAAAPPAPDVLHGVWADGKPGAVSTAEMQRIVRQGAGRWCWTPGRTGSGPSATSGARNVAPKPDVPMSCTSRTSPMIGRAGRPGAALCCTATALLREEQAPGRGAAGRGLHRRAPLPARRPVWRALGGVMEIEPEGVRTCARATAPRSGSTPGAARGRSPAEPARRPGQTRGGRAKDDGRLPMDDHNTRIVVFGRDADAGPRGRRRARQERLPQRRLFRRRRGEVARTGPIGQAARRSRGRRRTTKVSTWRSGMLQ